MTTEYAKLLRICKNADIKVTKKNIDLQVYRRLVFKKDGITIYTTFWDNRFSLCKKTWKDVRRAMLDDMVEVDEAIGV